MEKITVNVSWCNKNFAASMGDNVPGAVVFTAATFEELLREARETLEFHVQGMLDDGDDVPQWLAEGDYEFELVYADTASLLRSSERFASMAAISRATGINQRQLSHYATGLKHPRPKQRQRIVEGLHKIGRELMAFV